MKKYTGDTNSSNNQRIKDKLVEREVIMLASDIVEAFNRVDDGFFTEISLEACDYTDEELLQLYHDEYEGQAEQSGDAKNRQQQRLEFMHNQDVSSKEVYEWYFVTDRLASDLELKGEVIVRYFNSPLWGRQTTGQSISMDGVINDIAIDMEILEGQVNEWKL